MTKDKITGCILGADPYNQMEHDFQMSLLASKRNTKITAMVVCGVIGLVSIIGVYFGKDGLIIFGMGFTLLIVTIISIIGKD